MGPSLLNAEDVHSELAAIDWYLGEIQEDPAHLAAIDVLASVFRDASQRALGAQWMTVHRLASACADVAGWLRQSPAKITTGIPLLQEGRALIRLLLETGAAAKIPDPAGSEVYAVDNDPDNCECISMALEKAQFRTRYATKPDVAIAALRKAPVDLIILDVDLGTREDGSEPETDGFKLHDLIRATEHNVETPVIFVSGLLSTVDRIKQLPGEAASFVAKPYNLNELMLKGLCTIVSSRIRKLQTAAKAPRRPTLGRATAA